MTDTPTPPASAALPPPPPEARPARSGPSLATRIAEAIGLIGVVGSLLFVGLQVRQSTVATRAATNAAVADAFRDLALVQASSPALAAAFADHAADPAAAPAEAQVLMLGFWRALFHIWADVHRQHQNGTVDPALYDAIVREIASYAPGPDEVSAEVASRRRLMTWAWTIERFVFSTDFQRVVDDLLGPTAPPRPVP